MQQQQQQQQQQQEDDGAARGGNQVGKAAACWCNYLSRKQRRINFELMHSW